MQFSQIFDDIGPTIPTACKIGWSFEWKIPPTAKFKSYPTDS